MTEKLIKTFEELQLKAQPHLRGNEKAYSVVYNSVRNGLKFEDIEGSLNGFNAQEIDLIKKEFPHSEKLKTAIKDINLLNIKTTSIQDPNLFFTLLHYVSLSLDYTKIDFPTDKIVIATDCQYSSHALVYKDKDAYGILLSNFLLSATSTIAYYFAVIFKEIREKFGKDEDFIDLMTPQHLLDILNEKPKFVDIFSDLLMSIIATEQYNSVALLEPEISESMYHMNIMFAIRSFIINHELGHIKRRHFDTEHISYKDDIPVSKEILESVRKELCTKIGEENAENRIIEYFDKVFHKHRQELEADEEAFLTTAKIFGGLKVDPAYSWIGSAITLKVIDFIENVYFCMEHGCTHNGVSKNWFVVDILFPTSHPRSPTRVSCLGIYFNKSMGITYPYDEKSAKYRNLFLNILKMIDIPFSLSFKDSITRLFEIKNTDEEFYFIWDSRGDTLIRGSWNDIPEFQKRFGEFVESRKNITQ